VLFSHGLSREAQQQTNVCFPEAQTPRVKGFVDTEDNSDSLSLFLCCILNRRETPTNRLESVE